MGVAARMFGHPRRCPPSRVPRLLAHDSLGMSAHKHVGPTHASGERLCLRSLRAPDTEARQQKSEEGDTTSDPVMKHLDATITTYI
jgi:hypothetical protein